jgi:hypothetical protein
MAMSGHHRGMNAIAIPIALESQRRLLEGAVTGRSTARGPRRRTTRPAR